MKLRSNNRLPVQSARFAAFILFTSMSLCLAVSAAPVITPVQGNYLAPQSSQTTVSVTFTGAQTAGNLNVIVVGWNDGTSTVSSVSDSKGNTYQLAVGPTVAGGLLSQSIYYAKSIVAAAAGSNTVTVKFATPAAFPDVRILEYSGADPSNPVDVTAGGTGKWGDEQQRSGDDDKCNGSAVWGEHGERSDAISGGGVYEADPDHAGPGHCGR